MELFVDWLTEPNEKIVEFGIWGICNSCVGNCSDFIFGDIIISCLIVYLIYKNNKFWADPANSAIVTTFGGIPLIIQCLSSPVRNTVSIRAFLLVDIVSLWWLLSCGSCSLQTKGDLLNHEYSKILLIAFSSLLLQSWLCFLLHH